MAAGSLRSLSLDYHCCTHCWGERKVDSLILSVGCANRGKTPIPHCLISSHGGKLWFFERCLVRLVWCELCEQGCSSAVWGETAVWELEVYSGWGTLVCVLAGSPQCVNGAELKESFTERGSVKGMCRMWPGSSKGEEYEDIDGGEKKLYLEMKNLQRCQIKTRRWTKQKLFPLREARVGEGLQW